MVPTKSTLRPLALSLMLLGGVALTGCSSSEDRAKDHYERGLELVEQNEFTKASLEFRNALKFDRENVDAMIGLAGAEERQGNIGPAVEAYRAAAELDPKNVEARLRIIYILLAANQLDPAQEYVDQATKIAAEDPAVLVARASLALRKRDTETAVRLAKQAMEKEPDNADALLVLATERMMESDPLSAVRLLEKAPESADKNIGLQVLRISAMDAIGDKKGVEKLFEKLTGLFPENAGLRQAWVRWYIQDKRISDAEDVIRKFASQHFDDDQMQLSLISFLTTYRGRDLAVDELGKIIAKREENGGATTRLQTSLAQLYFQNNEQEKAIDLMNTVTSKADDPQAKNRAQIVLASMYLQTTKMDEALETANAVLSDDPKNADALRLRAAIKLRREDTDGAAEDILTALNQTPDSVQLNAMLASVYERQGSATLAEEQYVKAATLDKYSPATGLPMVRFLLRYGKNDMARRVLENVRQRAPENRQVLSLLGQLLLQSRDWVGAQEISQKLRELDDGSGTGEADRIDAAALSGQNRTEDSLKLLSESDANQQSILPDLIGSYVRAGRQDAAVSHLRSLLEENPDDIQARILLGTVLVSIDKIDEAEEAFKAAASADKGTVGNTALAQFYLSTSKFDEAERAVRAGLEDDPQNVALRMLLTTVYQVEGRFDDAIAEFEAMFKDDPESTIVANDLASLLSERRGDEQSLERAFEIAQRFRNSEIPQYKDTLGWIYYLRGQYASALPLLTSASSSLPNVGLIHYHLGMVFKAQNQTERAIASLETAVKLKTQMTETDIETANNALKELKSAGKSDELN